MLHNLPKSFFVLAPMDDVTDTVFRQIVHSCTPADLYFTEFVNVDGLMSPGRSKLLKKLRFSENEGPLVAQLWGLRPENFEAIARQIADGTIAREVAELNSGSIHEDGVQGSGEARKETYLGYEEVSSGAANDAIRFKVSSTASSAGRQARPLHNFVGIDINMGCPAKSEVQNGACSALILNRPLAQEIIEATKRGAGDMPVSVKTRLGFNEIDLSWHEFLLGFKLAMLTVHWRTRKEMSKVPAHWEYATEIIKLRNSLSKETLLVGNGDIENRKHGQEMIDEYGLDGIMIGRGVFSDPYVFNESSPWKLINKQERIKLFEKHVQLFAKTWQKNERPIHTLNKFCKIYINGFDEAKAMREVLMTANNTAHLLELLAKFKQVAI